MVPILAQHFGIIRLFCVVSSTGLHNDLKDPFTIRELQNKSIDVPEGSKIVKRSVGKSEKCSASYYMISIIDFIISVMKFRGKNEGKKRVQCIERSKWRLSK